MWPPIARLALITDFGAGIYVGQVLARLSALVPGLPLIDLVHDLPPFRPDLAAYLLPALSRDLPAATLYLCVVDPGVGGERAGLVLEVPREVPGEGPGADLYVGPDNGLLSQVARRTPGARVWRIDWQPPGRSASFHGRDWFAPVAAALACGERVALGDLGARAIHGFDWPAERPAIVYVDGYGNLMTGVRASACPSGTQVLAGGRTLAVARTFCEVPVGSAFWYENALGLVEIAVNQGRADQVLGLGPGDPVGLPGLGSGAGAPRDPLGS